LARQLHGLADHLFAGQLGPPDFAAGCFALDALAGFGVGRAEHIDVQALGFGFLLQVG
jgi:hypothetical protein